MFKEPAITSTSEWTGKGCVYPPMSNSPLNCSTRNSKITRPFHKVSSFPVKRNKPIIALITTLFFLGGPMAIIGRIVTVIIFTINRMLYRRPWPHISEKRFKRESPFIAYFNTASAVSFKRMVIRIHTSVFHAIPYPIFRTLAHIMSSISGWPAATTTTRHSKPTLNLIRVNGGLISTITVTEPFSTFVDDANANSGQATKPFARNILKLHRSILHAT